MGDEPLIGIGFDDDRLAAYSLDLIGVGREERRKDDHFVIGVDDGGKQQPHRVAAACGNHGLAVFNDDAVIVAPDRADRFEEFGIAEGGCVMGEAALCIPESPCDDARVGIEIGVAER